jgi:hypothetical protein
MSFAKHAKLAGTSAGAFATFESNRLAHHEAAHAVIALAVGVEIESLRLLPMPRAGLVHASLDDYQLAVASMAGHIIDMSSYDLAGASLAQLHALGRSLPPGKDVAIVFDCAARAAEVSEPATAADRAAAKTWVVAVGLVTNQLVASNWAAIKRVAAALLESPSGLAVDQVRSAAGGLALMPRDCLRSAIDQLAQQGLESA